MEKDWRKELSYTGRNEKSSVSLHQLGSQDSRFLDLWADVVLCSAFVYGAPETTNKLLHSTVTPKNTIAHSDLVECIVKRVQGDKNAKISEE